MKEIELRSSLDVKQAQEIIAALDARGAKWQEVRRVFMDFSDSIEDRARTVALRSNNSELELVVKSGGIADTVRQESNIVVSNGARNTIETLNLLGYSKASCGLRQMKSCVLGGIEYSLRYVVKFLDPEEVLGVNFELELVSDGGADDLQAAMSELGLKTLSDQELKILFSGFHKNANYDFVYSPEEAEKLAKILEDRG